MSGQRIKVYCKDGYHFWGQDSWYCNHDGNWEGYTWGLEEEWPMCLSKWKSKTVLHVSKQLERLHLGTWKGMANVSE